MKILTNLPWIERVEQKIEPKRVLSEQSLRELRDPEKSFESTKALVYNSKIRNEPDLSVRDTLRYSIDYRWFPEICEEIENHINDGTKVNQFDLLYYEKGGKFKRHLDESRGEKAIKRIWSTITLIDKSDDLMGGDLVIYTNEKDQVGQVIDLQIGETVVFSSQHVWHEITEVTRGNRLSLVTWSS